MVAMVTTFKKTIKIFFSIFVGADERGGYSFQYSFNVLRNFSNFLDGQVI